MNKVSRQDWQTNFVQHLLALLDYSKATTAIVLAYMCGEEKRYKLAGYSTERDFIERRAGLSYRQGRKYKKVGQVFHGMFPLDLDEEKWQLTATSEDANDVLPVLLGQQDGYTRMVEFMNKIGIEKFHQLTRFEIDLDVASKSGIVVLKDGTEISLDELVLAKVADLEETLHAGKSKSDRKHQQEKARREKAESERDYWKRLAESREELERRYGPGASTLEAKKRCRVESENFLDQALRLGVQINVDEDDPEELLESVGALVDKFEMVHQRLAGLYSFTLHVKA